MVFAPCRLPEALHPPADIAGQPVITNHDHQYVDGGLVVGITDPAEGTDAKPLKTVVSDECGAENYRQLVHFRQCWKKFRSSYKLGGKRSGASCDAARSGRCGGLRQVSWEPADCTDAGEADGN